MLLYKIHKPKSRTMTLRGVLPSLAGGERRANLFCTYSRLQQRYSVASYCTVYCSCWNNAIVLYMIGWKSPLPSNARTLCYAEQPIAITRQLNFCYIRKNEFQSFKYLTKQRYIYHNKKSFLFTCPKIFPDLPSLSKFLFLLVPITHIPFYCISLVSTMFNLLRSM